MDIKFASASLERTLQHLVFRSSYNADRKSTWNKLIMCILINKATFFKPKLRLLISLFRFLS
jgi:hypothetical protein